MKKYMAFFRLRFTMGIQYRIAALAGVFTQFFWGFMLIMTYKAFYEADAAAFPMTFSAVVSYMWLQQAFMTLFAALMEQEITNAIVSGNIAYELCRPIRIYDMWFVKILADRGAKAMLRCAPILCVAFFLPEPYCLKPPASALHLLFFVLTLALGVLVMTAFQMVIYGMDFFTVSPQGLRTFSAVLIEFCSGAVIPLPFFPENVQKVMELLPFASMQNVALRVYSGSLRADETARAVVLQVAWFVALTAGGRMLCRVAERKVTVQGG